MLKNKIIQLVIGCALCIDMGTSMADSAISVAPNFGPANSFISVKKLCAAYAKQDTCYVYVNCSDKPIKIGSYHWVSTTRMITPYFYLVDRGQPFANEITIMSVGKNPAVLGSGRATNSLMTNQATRIVLDSQGQKARVANYSDKVGCL